MRLRGVAARATIRMHWWQSDLQEYSAVQDFSTKCRPDVVYHLAGQVTAAPDLELVLPTFHSLSGARSMCWRLARRPVAGGSSLRALSPSRSEVDPEPIPCSPYAAAKWSATAYARMFH